MGDIIAAIHLEPFRWTFVIYTNILGDIQLKRGINFPTHVYYIALSTKSYDVEKCRICQSKIYAKFNATINFLKAYHV